ncbi:hypothetical protein Glove_428g40 [Diversispora epigaea]|uniref:Uncharacterized protein n=1 Tax=Diversispora epigaea TaxID=1348612 RepID=A0A397GUR5_9GLOM|nr:hypothetical protein Glove_428g40 [Diversispora epigaea]
MKEVEIWDYGIKWGITQNPTLPTNLEKWTNENFTHIIQHSFVPDRPVKSIVLSVKSVLITELSFSEDHAAEISSWIELLIQQQIYPLQI